MEAVGAALASALGLLGACGGVAATPSPDGGSSGSGSGGSGSGSSSGTVSCGAHPCSNPAAVIVGGQDTGFDTCAGGSLRRRASVECPVLLPRQSGACPYPGPDAGGFGDCASDSDCTAHPYGTCVALDPGSGCACNYGCVRDGDCQAGEICVCGDPVGQCERAACSQDSACAPGCDCIDATDDPGCPGKSFACQTPSDQCAVDTDCPSGEMCSSDSSGHHVCSKMTCAVGRPFIVRGDERLAPSSARGDWSARGVALDLRGLSARTRAALAERWTQIGLMEHASIAAFARFALQLLAVGAPPGLVRASQESMGDETEHARLAFAVASAYAGSPVGPGALAIDGSLDGFDVAQLVATLLREGCIGETVAAIEAREALERAMDPAVRAVLETIARDGSDTRSSHGARSRGSSPRAGSRAKPCSPSWGARAARLRSRPRPGRHPRGAPTRIFSTHGLVSDTRRAQLRREALATVVLPCARALGDDRGATLAPAATA